MKLNSYSKYILLSFIALTMVNSAEAGYLLTQVPAKSVKEDLALELRAHKKDRDGYFIINKETGSNTYTLETIDKEYQQSNLYSMPTQKTIIANNLSERSVLSKVEDLLSSQKNPLFYEGTFIEVIQQNTKYKIVLVEAQKNISAHPQKGSLKHKFLCEGMGWICPPQENYTGESDSNVKQNMVSVLGEHSSTLLGAKSCSFISAQEDANKKCINDYNGSPGKRLAQNPIINSFTVTCQVQVECFLKK